MSTQKEAIDQYKEDEEILGPPGTKITKAKIKQLLHSPSHLRVKHRTLTVSYIGIAFALVTVISIGLSCWWGYKIIITNRWLGYLYAGAVFMIILWAGFGMMFAHDIRTLQDPAWLQIDNCQMFVSLGTSIGLQIHLFRKNMQYADVGTFNLRCPDSETGCSEATWGFYRYVTIILPVSLMLVGILQITYSYLLYHDPIINPPPLPKGMGPDGMPLPPKGGAPPSYADSDPEKNDGGLPQYSASDDENGPLPGYPGRSGGFPSEKKEKYDPPADKEMGRSKSRRDRKGKGRAYSREREAGSSRGTTYGGSGRSRRDGGQRYEAV